MELRTRKQRLHDALITVELHVYAYSCAAGLLMLTFIGDGTLSAWWISPIGALCLLGVVRMHYIERARERQEAKEREEFFRRYPKALRTFGTEKP